jgi:hypothetical protein
MPKPYPWPLSIFQDFRIHDFTIPVVDGSFSFDFPGPEMSKIWNAKMVVFSGTVALLQSHVTIHDFGDFNAQAPVSLSLGLPKCWTPNCRNVEIPLQRGIYLSCSFSSNGPHSSWSTVRIWLRFSLLRFLEALHPRSPGARITEFPKWLTVIGLPHSNGPGLFRVSWTRISWCSDSKITCLSKTRISKCRNNSRCALPWACPYSFPLGIFLAPKVLGVCLPLQDQFPLDVAYVLGMLSLLIFIHSETSKGFSSFALLAGLLH